ncbi:MAG: bifunctional glutamate--cysteine ligase GshA/glutathione synthetase GshB, partial [Vallitaleaceae bacterium]|nr:bifunctional glutamate--cysteine ligase GshA/glutathione synthetase GshB [Vallitaleaceae bacterium]
MNLQLLHIIMEQPQLKKGLFKGHYGIEKENVRVTDDGLLALSKHPAVFGDKLYNPYFYNDFSESQVELITPVFDNLPDAYHFLSTINDLFMNNIGDELLWPQSAPPILPEEALIPIADFGKSEIGIERRRYREVLAKRYGKKKQMISGIHYNYSFDSDFIDDLYAKSKTEKSFIDFKNSLYLKISRNFIKYAWLPTYLFGASPATDSTYMKCCVEHMAFTSKGDPYFEYATSIRNGVCGYRNNNNYIISYDSVNQYIEELQALIGTGKIQNEKEYYSPIRLKTHSSDNFMRTLKEEGITYIEIRLLDIDPFDYNGISLDTMRFMHLFLLFLLFKEEDCFGEELHQISLDNYEMVAGKGRTPNLEIKKHMNESIKLSTWGSELLIELKEMMEAFGFLDAEDHIFLNQYINEFLDPSISKSAKILKGVKADGYTDWHLNLSRQHLAYSKVKPYILKGCETLELSTQILIKDAIKRGIKVEILDEVENFIMLRKDNHVEYIKQATKTSLDTYNSFLIMENKVVTKEILDRAGISVPKGGVYSSMDEAMDAYDSYAKKAFVIKPKSTNFGIGITIFKNGA